MKGKIIAICIFALIGAGIYYWITIPNTNSLQGQMALHDPNCVKELGNLPTASSQGIPSSNPLIQHFIQDGCGAFYDSNGNKYPLNANFTIYPNTQAGLLK